MLVCSSPLAYEGLTVCCLCVAALSLFVCYCFHEQFPWCAGVRPAGDVVRLVAFSRFTVARGNRITLEFLKTGLPAGI
jgi:hypothetical protein